MVALGVALLFTHICAVAPHVLYAAQCFSMCVCVCACVVMGYNRQGQNTPTKAFRVVLQKVTVKEVKEKKVQFRNIRNNPFIYSRNKQKETYKRQKLKTVIPIIFCCWLESA